ncbi:hypothetical protein ASC77_25485 [Nocardioides sp. Root1257]|uniref:hypothetical protein n=1 Tax=unclassified Nocardioides TaxID=2615069 RepID=UPI0006F97044|nr:MULTISPECIES: hypothetical protein [unclassified Nocardioides]KQW50682.1 hypothetical protein ASC77_25485 [Nocardioides sp. Root1257]KRC51508.1 hypothetical protein ASE24_25715 [Nocardioides sp. Root224]
MSGAEITNVSGGADGIEAMYAAVRALADTLDRTGDELRGWAGDGFRALADPDLTSSAPLSPPTFALAEAAVVAAVTGPAGLLPGVLAWEADARLVRAAVLALEASDEATHLAIEAVDWRLGLVAGLSLRCAGPALAGVVGVLPPDARARLGGGVQRWLVGHPGAVQHAVNGSGGLLTGLSGVPVPGNRAATALLATAYDDGDPVTTRRPDLGVAARDRQPDSVEGLVGHLAQVAALSPDPDSRDNGTLEVQTLDGGTDRARHIVYVPGTDDLGTLPWTQDDDVRDLGSDLRSAAGEPTSYQRGILEAMRRAGIGPHEPVLLVGHSLGGMEAAALASRDTGFTITDVVTAGSPTAQVDGFPDGVHVLSLEHRGDVVPLLDGTDNPDSTQQTTVAFTDGHDTTVVGAHGYGHYEAGAAAVDASGDPSLVAERAGLRERGFLGGSAQVTSQVFQVVRAR